VPEIILSGNHEDMAGLLFDGIICVARQERYVKQKKKTIP
jgi:hypothetical protein